jgi:hypothetical protein
MKRKMLRAFALLLIIIGILLFLTARYADRLVDPFVRSLLEQNKPMNHRIDYRKIRVNLITRQIHIKDARIYPDSSLVRDENIWMEINVDLIKLTDFSLKDLLLHKTLKIGDFIMLKPDVSINLPVKVTEKTIDEVSDDSTKVKKAQALTGISLERAIISGGTFRLIQNDAVLASTNEISFLAKDIILVKNSLDEPVGYSYGQVKIGLSNIKLRSETGLYDMSLDKFQIDKEDSSIVLNGFKMKPKYDKKEFTKQLDFQKERFDLVISTIEIAGIGYRRLLDGQPLEISKISLDSVYADIFKDKTIPFDPNKFPLFFNESLLKLSIPVDLDTLSVTNSTLLYNELTAGRTEVGLIRLDDFNLQAYNITTHPQDDSLENVLKADIQANIMGEGPMNVQVTFPLEGNLRHVECYGSVGAMHLSPLNAFLEPSLNIKFNAGTVTRMTFSFSGDENVSNGWMEFLYKDVDIVLLKKEPGKEFGFFSFLANTMTNSNNPETGKDKIKSVEIGVERDKNKGPINYIWRTIQSGMLRTILPVSKYNINHKELEKKAPGTTKDPQKKDGKKKKKE